TFSIAEQTGPNTIDFGCSNICSGDRVREGTITNLACSELNLEDLRITDTTMFTVISSFEPTSLDAGPSRTYLVRFRPKFARPEGSTLKVVSRTGTQIITLTGCGVPGGRGLRLVQPIIQAQICDSVEVLVNLRNLSCGPVRIKTLTVDAPLTVISFSPVQLET